MMCGRIVVLLLGTSDEVRTSSYEMTYVFGGGLHETRKRI